MTHATPPDLIDLPAGLTPDVVTALAARSVRRDSVSSFQALLAALAQAVEATVEPVAQAERASLSLRQSETVAAVGADLRELLAALAAGVSAEGQCLKPRPGPVEGLRSVLTPAPGWLPRLTGRAAPVVPPAPTWLAAASAAVDVLGQTAAHVATLAAAQPEASSARLLGLRAADLLETSRGALLADVARLVD